MHIYDELADIFSVSRNSVRVQLEDKKKGGIGFYKIGGQYRVPGSSALEAFGSSSYQFQGENKPITKAGDEKLTFNGQN